MQLWIFIQQILTFDYGASWSTGESVSQIILTRLGPSLTLLVPLVILQTVISIVLALAVGIGTWFTDRPYGDDAVYHGGMSISILVYIIVFQYVLAYQLGWFPVQGWSDQL